MINVEHPHFRCRFKDAAGSCDRSCCITLLVSATRVLAPGGAAGQFHRMRITGGLQVIRSSWIHDTSVDLRRQLETGAIRSQKFGPTPANMSQHKSPDTTRMAKPKQWVPFLQSCEQSCLSFREFVSKLDEDLVRSYVTSLCCAHC